MLQSLMPFLFCYGYKTRFLRDIFCTDYNSFIADEDRLSEISARSAASSLRAFQTLARARKRKENFWGKS